MVYCCAYSCNSSRASPGNSLYRFPLGNKDILKQWLAKIKQKNFTPTKASRLCNLHFERDCFEPSGSREFLASIGYSGYRNPRLKPGAIPTIFNYNESKLAAQRTAVLKLRKKQLPSISSQQINDEMLFEVTENSISNSPNISFSIDEIYLLNKNEIGCQAKIERKTRNVSCQTLKIQLRSKNSQT